MFNGFVIEDGASYTGRNIS